MAKCLFSGALPTYFFLLYYSGTPGTYTFSLHDALPIFPFGTPRQTRPTPVMLARRPSLPPARIDRKSTRLNSSHRCISYAVFCVKKTIIQRVLQIDSI